MPGLFALLKKKLVKYYPAWPYLFTFALNYNNAWFERFLPNATYSNVLIDTKLLNDYQSVHFDLFKESVNWANLRSNSPNDGFGSELIYSKRRQRVNIAMQLVKKKCNGIQKQ